MRLQKLDVLKFINKKYILKGISQSKKEVNEQFRRKMNEDIVKIESFFGRKLVR